MNEKTKDKLALLFPEKREEIRSGDLYEMRFESLDLSRLDFSDANFRESVFDNCILSQSTFSRCFFRLANIKNCIVEQAIFTDSTFGEAEIIDSKFDHSFIMRCDLGRECSVRDSSFIRVNFTGSTFVGGMSMEGCHFEGSCLDQITGLDQEYLKKLFWMKLNKKQGWRAVDSITKKSLLGTNQEKAGVVIEIPRHEVNLDPREGCAPGLHICRSKRLADKFGKEHCLDYKLIPVDFKFKDILVVHLSGDFCRVNKYKVMASPKEERSGYEIDSQREPPFGIRRDGYGRGGHRHG